MNDKVILTDCDGVLLDWEKSFHEWMSERGHETVRNDFSQMYKMSERFNMSYEESRKHVRIFNESARIGYLEAFRDSRWFVRLLHQRYGYDFICITSLSTDPYAKKLRQANLDRLFGRGTFRELVCLECGADKDEVLAEYAERYPFAPWVEDKPQNADAGLRVGLKSILLSHPHNFEYEGLATVLEDWREIYEYVTDPT